MLNGRRDVRARVLWRAVTLAALAAAVAGCLDRTRVNTTCQWTPERAGALDVAVWPQQRHLYADVEIAEELAIRYADAVHRERFGYGGHGGLIENGRLRDRCMATLLGAIASTHRLSLERVVRARERGYRDPRWDVGVVLSFVVLYGVAAWRILRSLSRRFSAEERWPAAIATVLLAIPVGILAYQLLALWGGALEAFRLGNGHVSSYRAAKSPWMGHGAALSAASAVLFLMLAGAHAWLERGGSRWRTVRARSPLPHRHVRRADIA